MMTNAEKWNLMRKELGRYNLGDAGRLARELKNAEPPEGNEGDFYFWVNYTIEKTAFLFKNRHQNKG